MANLNSHPLVRAAYEACLAVEMLPASLEQTAAISAVSALLDPIEALALELAETRRERDTAVRRWERLNDWVGNQRGVVTISSFQAKMAALEASEGEQSCFT